MGRGKPVVSPAVLRATTPPAVEAQSKQAILAWLRRQPALRVGSRRRPQGVLASGIAALDELLGGGLPAGAISELVGRRGAGRASLALAILAATTRRGGVVAWVDAGDSLDPLSVAAAGGVLERFLWVRLAGKGGPSQAHDVAGPHRARGRLQRAVEATDLLLEAGGFAAVVLDMASLRSRAARLATWVRLERRLEHARTSLILLASHATSGCASLRLVCRRAAELTLQVQIDRQRGRAAVGMGVRVALAPPVD